MVHNYRIVVSGGLDDAARVAFSGHKIVRVGDNTEAEADLDDTALFAMLDRIDSLGLELVELVRAGRPANGKV